MVYGHAMFANKKYFLSYLLDSIKGTVKLAVMDYILFINGYIHAIM